MYPIVAYYVSYVRHACMLFTLKGRSYNGGVLCGGVLQLSCMWTN